MDYLFFAVELFYKTLILYLAIMHIDRYKDTLTLDEKIMFSPIVVIGLFCNVFFRYTVGFILKFPEFKKDDLMFTSVLQTYKDEDSWKGKVSRYLCRILSKFDARPGGHC